MPLEAEDLTKMILDAAPRDPSEADVVDKDDSPLQSTVQKMIREAKQWREENLDPDQTKATDYYMGRPFGNEAKGRSAVVLTIVRDTVKAILPSLMRIFFGSDRTVEFVPKGLEDAEAAEQQTDYINHVVIQQDNDGFAIHHAGMKDALVRKLGIFKWWWEEAEEVEGKDYTGLTSNEVDGLRLMPDVDEVTIEDSQLVEIPNQPPLEVFDVHTVTRREAGRARFAVIPGEEFLFSPDARDIDEAGMVGHVRHMSASDLIAMGIPEDLVEQHKHTKSRQRDVSDGDLWAARRGDDGAIAESGETRAKGDEGVLYGEIYVRHDMDDDGIAEMLMVPVIGKNHEVIESMIEVVGPRRPFAIITPDPEPHTLVGLSVADDTMDLQLIMSSVARGVLDSLTLTLHPKVEADINKVEIEDLLNEEIGGVIRSDGTGNVLPFQHSFVGAEGLNVLEYFNQVRENRTGISKASAGLAPDALQSSTRAAVAATVDGARQHIEMIARVFAETGFKRLYAGLYELVKENQDRPRTVRLRGRYVDIDPRDWDAEMDVVVNIALGGSTKEEKLLLLEKIIADQKEQLLAGSPLVDLTNLRHSYATGVEASGFRNPDAFYKVFGQAELQEFQQQQAQQPPKQDPEMALVEVERMRAEAMIQLEQQKAEADLLAKRQQSAIDLQIKQVELLMKRADLEAKHSIGAAKVELEQQKAAAEDDRKRDEMELKHAIEQAKIEADAAVKINDQEIKADIAAAEAAQGDVDSSIETEGVEDGTS